MYNYTIVIYVAYKYYDTKIFFTLPDNEKNIISPPRVSAATVKPSINLISPM